MKKILSFQILAELEEAGSETIATIANTVEFTDDWEFHAAVDHLVRQESVTWGESLVLNGRGVYQAVEPQDWSNLRQNDDGAFVWEGEFEALLMIPD